MGIMNHTRRGLLAAAGLATAALTPPATLEAAQEREPEKKFPPLENFKYDLEAHNGWTGKGGSAKEATVLQFPLSESMAGVSMRLKPGAMRELHWHSIAAEWAYVISGNVRGTVIAPNGQAEQSDFTKGDVWYFPKGHGHAVQNLGPGDAHFLLVFDDGHFSEFGTLSVTDWLALTPPDVLQRNLGIPASAIPGMYKKEVYITDGGTLPPKVKEALMNSGAESQTQHKFRLDSTMPRIQNPTGWIRLVSQKEFPIQTTLTGALQEIAPGGMREMHWHPNADEWQYYLGGKGRIRIFGGHGRVATNEFTRGQVGFIRQGFGHYVENIGDEPLRFIAMFNNGTFEEISITSWLAGNPMGMLTENLGLSERIVKEMPQEPRGFV